MNLTEATMLALQGKLVENKCKRVVKKEGIITNNEDEYEFEDLYDIVGHNGKLILDEIKDANKVKEFMEYLYISNVNDETGLCDIDEISDFIDYDHEIISRDLGLNKKEEARSHKEDNEKASPRNRVPSFEGGPNELSARAGNTLWNTNSSVTKVPDKDMDKLRVKVKGDDFNKVVKRDVKRNRVRSVDQAINRKNAGQLDFAGTNDMLNYEVSSNQKSRELRKQKGMVTTEARNPENDEINDKIRHPFDGDNTKDIRKSGLRARKDKYSVGDEYYEISNKDGSKTVNVDKYGRVTKGFQYQHPDFDIKNYLTKEKPEGGRDYETSINDTKASKRDRIGKRDYATMLDSNPAYKNKSFEPQGDETIQQYKWAKTSVDYAQKDVDDTQAKLDQAKADRKSIITNRLAQIKADKETKKTEK